MCGEKEFDANNDGDLHLRLAIIPDLQEGDVAKAKELLKKETKETIDQVQLIYFKIQIFYHVQQIKYSEGNKTYRYTDYYRSSIQSQLNERTFKKTFTLTYRM